MTKNRSVDDWMRNVGDPPRVDTTAVVTEYTGSSGETKPFEGENGVALVATGSTFFESDTGITYVWQPSLGWVVLQASSNVELLLSSLLLEFRNMRVMVEVLLAG